MTNSPRSEPPVLAESPLEEIDPFDLPEWLGTERVVWTQAERSRSGHHLHGELTGPAGQARSCDLLAVDVAYPVPVVAEEVRAHAHQFWVRGEVLTTAHADGRLTLAVPGTRFEADLVLEALGRFARAVGAAEERYVALLSVGNRRRSR